MLRSCVFFVLALALPALSAVSADAAGTIPRPPPVVSPDLADAWLLQMKPGHQKPVVAPQKRAASAAPNVGRSLFKPKPKQRTHGVAPEFLPQMVRYRGSEAPGTIVIDTGARFLYLVLDGGMAKRYGIGVGRPGFEWAGMHTVTRMAEWPDWTLPPELVAREADRGRILPASVKHGPANPLGARALYLGDTLYRIHGSNEPWTIGHAVSSGCIRMRNDDVTDLYNRVEVGAKVLVR